MTDHSVTRRLAAILAADVVGYSRMVGADEEGTLARLKALRAELIDPSLAQHGGRIVKTTGDGILVEFASAVDAVRNAIAIQGAMARRNEGAPEETRFVFRIGINLGDIVVDGDDILGDGVNVAARLEGIAEPGGIYISDDLHRQVEGKIDARFEDLGEFDLKNIERRIPVWRVALDQRGHAAASAVGDGGALALPDKPSIAVLPFQNMSGDADQEYFADGITEDIITALSRIRWFFVIARNSSFAYKGRSPNVRDVARELGVGYVLEGSVRKAGNRVRISAQLIDGATGNHVWAKRYDRELEDVFDLQDELTETIVGAIEPEMGKAERDRAKTKRPENLRAWDLYQRGMWHTCLRTGDDLAEAQRLFARARELAPGLAAACAGSAEAYFFQIVDGHLADREACIDDAIRLGRRAVDLDAQDAMGHYALGRAYTIARRHDEAIPELEAAIELNPSSAQAYYALGMALGTSGRPREAIPQIETAIRLSPHDPYIGQFLLHIGAAHLFMGNHAEAAEWARRALRQPNIRWSRWALLISALGHLGQSDEAGRAIGALAQFRPEIDLAFISDNWPIADPNSRQSLVDGLRKAGMKG